MASTTSAFSPILLAFKSSLLGPWAPAAGWRGKCSSLCGSVPANLRECLVLGLRPPGSMSRVSCSSRQPAAGTCTRSRPSVDSACTRSEQPRDRSWSESPWGSRPTRGSVWAWRSPRGWGGLDPQGHCAVGGPPPCPLSCPRPPFWPWLPSVGDLLLALGHHSSGDTGQLSEPWKVHPAPYSSRQPQSHRLAHGERPPGMMGTGPKPPCHPRSLLGTLALHSHPAVCAVMYLAKFSLAHVC